MQGWLGLNRQGVKKTPYRWLLRGPAAAAQDEFAIKSIFARIV